MRVSSLAAIAFLAGVGPAWASPSWTLISISAPPQNAAQIVAAADELMGSPAGQEFPGRLLLQVHVADGANPATHSFVPIYRSAAAREAFVQKLQADPAWPRFQEKLQKLSSPVSTMMYRTLKSYGQVSDDDRVWEVHAFDVGDPAAFAAALDAFMTSETGKRYPGQVHLSSVAAGGLSPVSHVISVGFASEAELETWVDSLAGNAAWSAYLAASRGSAEYLGANLTRDVKAWGRASLADLTAP